MYKYLSTIGFFIVFVTLLFSFPHSIFAADCAWTGSVSSDWATAGNWISCGGNVPGPNDNVLIESGPDVHISAATTINELIIAEYKTLIFDYDAINNGAITIHGDLFIDAFSLVTHAQATATSGGTIAGTVSFVVEGGATINGTIAVDGKGYPVSSGTGQGCDNSNGAGGGGYGGIGGRGAGCSSIGMSYGEFRNQNPLLGSGGGEQQAIGYGVSGAGGGAIELIVTGTLDVEGVIVANGEDGTGNNGAGGSGGSITLSANRLEGDGDITAWGGSGGPYAGGGGGGRIYVNVYTNALTGNIEAFAGVSGEQVPTTSPPTEGTVVIYYPTVDNDVDFKSDIVLKPSDEPLEYGLVRVFRTMSMQSDIVSSTRAGVHIKASNLELMGSSASINATGLGYPESEGPGQGYDNDGASGGGFGGRGAAGYSTSMPGGDLYAKFTDLLTAAGKITVGSGAGSNTSEGWGISGAGGGGIWLEILDTLSMASGSSIMANGANGSGNNGGGGSGGAIYLDVGTLSGGNNATISANGGNGGNYGGGGGGGRVFIELLNDYFTGTLTVNKGTSGSNITKGATDGSAVIVDYNNLHLLSNMTLRDADGTIHYNDITVGNNVTISMLGSNLSGTSGVGVTMEANGTFTLPVSSTITANGLGYPLNLGNSPGCSGDGPGGGAHGGGGTRGYGCGGTSSAYGNANGPVTLGSGGGNNTSGPGWGVSAAGGGAIKIIAHEDMVVDGTISANSGVASGNNGAGGAGGSIWLRAEGTLSGVGLVSANGGNGQAYGGGGGGGRILFEYGTNDFEGDDNAIGGSGGAYSYGGNAGSGTITYTAL